MNTVIGLMAILLVLFVIVTLGVLPLPASGALLVLSVGMALHADMKKARK